MAIAVLKDLIMRKSPKFIKYEISFAIRNYYIYNNHIYYKSRLFIPANNEFKMQIVYRVYNSGSASHSKKKKKTIELIGRLYFWLRITQDIQAFVKACEFCGRMKASRSIVFEYLHPLSVLFQAWQDILVNYITILPICERNGEKHNL
jgi:hypothetical protein